MQKILRRLRAEVIEIERYVRNQWRRVHRSGAYTGWHDRGRLQIGRHSYGDPDVIVFSEAAGTVEIGAFCSIAHGVEFALGGGHNVHWVTTNPNILIGADRPEGHPPPPRNILVGNDVWIGRSAKILEGVTIGDGAVIGAYSVVTKDVAPYTIVAGNPARIIRKRFPDEMIARILATQWWGWSDEVIHRALPLLWSSDLEAFLAHADQQDESGAGSDPRRESCGSPRSG